MLTETDARDLLHLAADTIDVHPTSTVPVTVVRRHIWPVLAAAAAVLAVVGGIAAVALRGSAPDQPITPSPSPTSATTGVLAPDQIPSVFGYDGRSARELLESVGLSVRVDTVPSCEVGRAIDTRPRVGTRFDPGDVVRLRVATSSFALSCPSLATTATAWQLLDFADGRDAAPVAMPQVTLSVNGRQTAVTSGQFADPSAWPSCTAADGATCPGSALDVLREAARTVVEQNGRWRTPELSVTGSATRQSIWIGVPVDGQFGPRWSITVVNDGAISSVDLVWHESGPLPTGPTTTQTGALAPDQIPSVFGYDSASARAMLENLGLGVAIDIVPSCDAPRRAVGTNPQVGTPFRPGDVVELQVSNGDDNAYCALTSDAAAWGFLDFANGRGPAPEFAPEVTLTVNGVSTTVTAEEAADPASWPMCDATVRDCPGSALDVIREESARVQPLADGTWETPGLSVLGGAETERLSIGFLTEGHSGQWHVTLHWQPLNSRPVSLLTAVELTWPDAPGAFD